MLKTYDLYYKDVCLGSVTEDGRDFPNMFGILNLKRDAIQTLERPARNSVLISLKELTEDSMTEEQFEELMQWICFTEDWTLQIDGETHHILPPTIGRLMESDPLELRFFSWRWSTK